MTEPADLASEPPVLYYRTTPTPIPDPITFAMATRGDEPRAGRHGDVRVPINEALHSHSSPPGAWLLHLRDLVLEARCPLHHVLLCFPASYRQSPSVLEHLSQALQLACPTVDEIIRIFHPIPSPLLSSLLVNAGVISRRSPASFHLLPAYLAFSHPAPFSARPISTASPPAEAAFLSWTRYGTPGNGATKPSFATSIVHSWTTRVCLIQARSFTMVSNQLTRSGWGRRPHYGNWELSNAECVPTNIILICFLPPADHPAGEQAYHQSLCTSDPQNLCVILTRHSIKCRRCEKVKPTRFFSNKQLKELADHCDTFHRIKGKTYDARSAAHIHCETCSGQPAVELECYRMADIRYRSARPACERSHPWSRQTTMKHPVMKTMMTTIPTAVTTVYTTTNSMRDMSITGSSIAASTSSQSGGVSLDGGSHHDGYVTADDGLSETSTIGPMTTRREYGGAFNMARNHANASGSSGDGAFPKMRSVPPHLRVAKDFELRRQHELAAAAKAKAQRNGAEPDDLDDVEVESQKDSSFSVEICSFFEMEKWHHGKFGEEKGSKERITGM
nr:hypothetical protein CFP56_56466 [Quercus suber]